MFRIVGAILIMLAVLIFLFRGLGPMAPSGTVHSTLQLTPQKP